MNPDDVLAVTEPSGDDGVFRIGHIVAPMFGIPVEFHVLGPLETQVVTPEMADALNEFLAAPTRLLGQIETLLSTDCDAMCRETGFSIFGTDVTVAPGQDPLEAHRLAFGMSAEGRIPAKVIAKWVSFIGLDVPNGAYVKFTPPWNQDYGVLIRLEDGAFASFILQYYHGDEDEFCRPMPE